MSLKVAAEALCWKPIHSHIHTVCVCLCYTVDIPSVGAPSCGSFKKCSSCKSKLMHLHSRLWRLSVTWRLDFYCHLLLWHKAQHAEHGWTETPSIWLRKSTNHSHTDSCLILDLLSNPHTFIWSTKWAPDCLSQLPVKHTAAHTEAQFTPPAWLNLLSVKNSPTLLCLILLIRLFDFGLFWPEVVFLTWFCLWNKAHTHTATVLHTLRNQAAPFLSADT